MATKKKPSKKITQKVNDIIKADVSKSLVITSILVNILFLATLIVLTQTDTFDRNLFVSSQERYCKNSNNLKERAKELGNKESAQKEWQVDCIGSDFYPFYKEAVDKYRASANQD